MARQVQIARCTRCNARGVSVTLVTEFVLPSDGEPGGHLIEAFGRCGICRKTMILRVRTSQNTVVNVNDGYMMPIEKLVGILPEAETAVAPPFVPEGVGKPFIEGVESILNRQWNAAGAMLRRSIERAVKDLDKEGKGDLKARIDALAEKGLIIKPVADWAHEARLGGNDAVHDEEDFTPEEAETLRTFAYEFLHAAYTMRERVKTGRAAAIEEMKKRKGVA